MPPTLLVVAQEGKLLYAREWSLRRMGLAAGMREWLLPPYLV
jgi:hypothetical protein